MERRGGTPLGNLEKYALYGAAVVSLLFVIWLLIRNLRREMEARHFHAYLRRVGAEGERQLLHTLLHLPGYKKVLTNLYLPARRRGNLTEVDLVCITKRGVFVVESKNYAAWIYGTDTDKNWLATFPNGDEFQFYNPILQNEAHIHALMRVLETDMKEYFTSVIVFGERTVFKDVYLEYTDAVLTLPRRFRRTMKKLMRRSPIHMSREDVKAMYNRLVPYGNADKETVKAHLRQMQRDNQR